MPNARLFVRKDRDPEFYVAMADKFAKQHSEWFIVASGTRAISTSCMVAAMIQERYNLVKLSSTTKRSSKAGHLMTEVVWTVLTTSATTHDSRFSAGVFPTMFVCSPQKVRASVQLNAFAYALVPRTPVRMAAAGIALSVLFQMLAQCHMQIVDFVVTRYDTPGKKHGTAGIVVITADSEATLVVPASQDQY